MTKLTDDINEAKDHIQRISSKLDMESVILDDWRLIYGISNTDNDAQIELEVDNFNFQLNSWRIPIFNKIVFTNL